MTSTFKRKWLPKNKIAARITPFNKLRETSFINRLNKEPLKVSLAKPCTIIAEDCTPTFPAMAAISGVKKNKFPCCNIASPNKPRTFTEINPPKRAKTSQGNRAFVCSRILSSASTSCEIPAAN